MYNIKRELLIFILSKKKTDLYWIPFLLGFLFLYGLYKPVALHGDVNALVIWCVGLQVDLDGKKLTKNKYHIYIVLKLTWDIVLL